MTDRLKLGANYDAGADSVIFRLFSENATRVVLAVFEGESDADPLANFELTRVGQGIWQTSVKKYVLFDLKKPFYYAYRVFGESENFKPDKFAYDPYALELSYKKGSKDFDTKSAFVMPETYKVRALASRPFGDEIIGEVHIKDLSVNIDIEEAGTFAGAGKMAPMLKKFGITMVEFLPLNEFDEDYDGGNYWGYMPLSYFALHKEYAHCTKFGTIDDNKSRVIVEFVQMVNDFHAHGIKVCMDVVYNHSAFNASFKLIDRDSYYKINEKGDYCDNCGCGNDLNCANEAYGNLVADSIAYFAGLGVDAFRFDLAAALLDVNCKGEVKYCKENSLAAKLPQMLSERGVKVAYTDGKNDHSGIVFIAEPWSCGGKDAYQFGNFPDFWWEWNDVARNTLRANSLRPAQANPLGLKNLLEGSPQILTPPTRSINYIASHDGLTLNDLNSYWIDGWEISGDHYGDFEAQKRAMKKQIALLLLSSGATMLQVGDLIAHTKFGNHNSYQSDDETNYLDFSCISRCGEGDEPSTTSTTTATCNEVAQESVCNRPREIFDFWSKMLDFRRKFRPQDAQREYFDEYVQPISPDSNNGINFLAFKGASRSNTDDSAATNGADSDFYVVISKNPTPIEFRLPEGDWELLIDCGKNSSWSTLEPFSLLIFVKR